MIYYNIYVSHACVLQFLQHNDRFQVFDEMGGNIYKNNNSCNTTTIYKTTLIWTQSLQSWENWKKNKTWPWLIRTQHKAIYICFSFFLSCPLFGTHRDWLAESKKALTSGTEATCSNVRARACGYYKHDSNKIFLCTFH